MSQTTVAKFDLNIEKILEGWEVHHALREVIANALDEQALTNTSDVTILKDNDGLWHIRDYGRGLKYDSLTQNENKEKLCNANKVTGKFGVGLKDALATLHRRGVKVTIRSKHGDISLELSSKHGFSDVVTLHACIAHPTDSNLIGTDVVFHGISVADVDKAKNFFLKFSGESVLDNTRHGQILRRETKGSARIYVKGLLVAQEEDFTFSYNITSLTTAMNKALNRERTNVGRTAYADRVKAMLLLSDSGVVAETLADELMRIEQGSSHDEVKWTDVAIHACQILNASKKVVFVTAEQRTSSPDAIDQAIGDGHKIVTVPENIKQRLRGKKDIGGNPVRDLQVYQDELSKSFEFKFIDKNSLSANERKVFEMRDKIASLVGGLPRKVKQIKISETMRPDFASTCPPVGLWEQHEARIIIKRSQLCSLEAFAGTLLHEIIHARTGYLDVSREFETALSDALGKTSAQALRRSALAK